MVLDPDLRGPAAILFTSRDACSDSIANYLALVFFWGGGGSHNYRAICCKMGHHTMST